MEILINAPVWVWPLLIGLVVIGVRALRARRVPIWMVCLLPALGLLGVNSVAGLPEATVAVWLVFAVVWLASAAWGDRMARRLIVGRDGGRVHLRGEVVTLIAVMVLFWANFGAGVLEAVAPEVLSDATGAAVFAGVLAAASGQFAGRALRAFLS